MSRIVPLDYQPKLPQDRIITRDEPGEEAIPMDVIFVGAGPAGLAGAIELARLVREDNEKGDGLGEVEIAVLEKAGELGEHSLSGAVVNPRSLRELFPEIQDEDFPFRAPVAREAVYWLGKKGGWKLPTPPTMKNHGNHVASLCELVRWLGEKAEDAGVNVFTGFPVAELMVKDQAVAGVRTTPSGLDREGNPTGTHEPAAELTARVTVLSEGCRGMLSQAWMDWQGVGSPNPQIAALGVKELWEVKRPLDRIIHTLGWPLPGDAFGGTFCYPMGEKQVAIGLVVGLDYHDQNLDVHQLLQHVKEHSLFRPILEGGELVEWGAKTIPEGGYHALPERMSGNGLLLAGDAAGFVDVPSLKGIHYAIQSGIYAARATFRALKAEKTDAEQLAHYDELIRSSYIRDDLYRTRNMRLAFKKGFYLGGALAGLMTLTGGRFPGGRFTMKEDAAAPRTTGPEPAFAPDGKLTFSKVDAVFKSGNKTRDTIPQHLIVGDDVPAGLAQFYSHLCPAGVYEVKDGKLVVNPPNCVDCKATDAVGPRWTPREGGSGPAYRQM